MSVVGPAAAYSGPPATTSVMAQPGVAATAAARTPTAPVTPAAPLPTTLGGPQGPRAVAQLPAGYTTPGGGVSTVAPSDVPAPLPSGPGAMTPAMQAYVSQFNASQEAQKQAINAGLVQALSGLGARRDAASKVATALPSALSSIYQGVAGTEAGGPQGPNGAGASAAVQGAEQTNAAQAKGDLAGSQTIAPLVQAGITADYSQGATALANTQMQDNASVAQQQSQFDEAMLQSQMNAQQAEQAAREQAALNVSTYKQENPQAALTPQQQQAAANTAALDTKATAAGLQNWQQVQQIAASPFYRAISEAILTGKTQTLPDGTGVHGSRQALIKQAAASNMDVVRAMYASGLLTNADMAAIGA